MISYDICFFSRTNPRRSRLVVCRVPTSQQIRRAGRPADHELGSERRSGGIEKQDNVTGLVRTDELD